MALCRRLVEATMCKPLLQPHCAAGDRPVTTRQRSQRHRLKGLIGAWPDNGCGALSFLRGQLLSKQFQTIETKKIRFTGERTPTLVRMPVQHGEPHFLNGAAVLGRSAGV